MQYPRHVVGAVVIQQRHLLMVKENDGPREGKWGFPGGSVEWGETLEEALKRELVEECNLEVEVQGLFRLSDYIVRRNGKVVQHFILSHYRCRVVGGELAAGSDAADARWVPVHELEEMRGEGGIIEQLLEGIVAEMQAVQENDAG